MEFYFTERFIDEFKKIIKAKEHKNLENCFIEEIFKKTFDEILKTGASRQSGDNNNSAYIKKRIGKLNSGKRGGYRSYIMILIKNKELYFIFIHPKAGRRSMVKLDSNEEQKIIKKFKSEKKLKNLIRVELLNAADNNPDKTDKIINSETKHCIF